MNNILECVNTSLELLKLVYADQSLGVSISIFINKAMEGSFGLL